MAGGEHDAVAWRELKRDLSAGRAITDDHHTTSDDLRWVAVCGCIELQHARCKTTSEGGNARTLEGSSSDDDGAAGNHIAVVQLCEEMLMLPQETRNAVAGDHGQREARGVALEVVAHLILTGITARVAFMGEPRQGADTSGREEHKGIEAPAPGVADSGMALVHDTSYASFHQSPSGGEPGLAGAHDQYVYHPSCGPRSLASQHDPLH